MESKNMQRLDVEWNSEADGAQVRFSAAI